jgi:hypothetical protein
MKTDLKHLTHKDQAEQIGIKISFLIVFTHYYTVCISTLIL